MSNTSENNSGALLALAQDGDVQAFGDLLACYGNYLQLLARVGIDRHLRSKVSPSDVVQDTFVQAKRCFHQFRGSTEQELLAWLRKILTSQLTASIRRYSAQQRDIRLEQQVGDRLAQSSNAINNILVAGA